MQVILDSTTEDAANVQLVISDTSANYLLTGLEIPDPELKSVFASSFDTEGDIPADEHAYQNRTVSVTLDVRDTTATLMETRYRELTQKIAKFNREPSTTTPGVSTLRVVFESGNAYTFDVVSATTSGPAVDTAFTMGNVAVVTLEFTCRPFARGTPITEQTDNFAVDSIGSGLWAVDAGGGTISVTGGVLDPSSTAQKRLHRTDKTYTDGEFTFKITTNTPVTALEFGPSFKWLDDSNYLLVDIIGSATNLLRIRKRDGGSFSNLATTAFTPGTSTSYWVRGRQEGNKVTAEVFTAAPGPATAPTATVTHTLAGGDITKFGVGVSGRAGLTVTPASAAETYDDWTATPWVYVEKTLPALETPPIHGVKGDVPGLGKLLVDNIDAAAADQWMVIWGRGDRYVSTATTSAYFYQAEALTPLGTSAIATGASGASGSGSNVMRNTDLSPTPVAMMSSQMLAASHLTHIGSYRVWARIFRPTGNTGAVTVVLEWGEGDFRRRTTNTENRVTFAANDREGSFTLIDMGLVHLTRATQGTQRWEFRPVVSSTTVGDEIDFDCFFIFPVDA